MVVPAITDLILMHQYLFALLEAMKKIRIQLLIGIFCFFIISLFLSTFSGQVFVLLWLVVGCFTLYFIKLTFPDVWNYVFWLISIYSLNFLGMLCLVGTRFTSNILFTGFGILIEMLSIGVFVLLILHLKAIRDDISGVTDRPDGMELEHEAAYIPLGIWSISVFFFWLVSNLSGLYWYNWSVGNWGPEAYLISDVILLLTLIYILWHPQMNFDWGVEPIVLPKKSSDMELGLIDKSLDMIPGLRKKVRVKSGLPKKCPICGSKTVTEQRTCKHCGQLKLFTWCKISEGYIVTCPHCKAETSYGKDRCINCGRLINKNVRCSCGYEHPISSWKKIGTIG